MTNYFDILFWKASLFSVLNYDVTKSPKIDDQALEILPRDKSVDYEFP